MIRVIFVCVGDGDDIFVVIAVVLGMAGVEENDVVGDETRYQDVCSILEIFGQG